jgi:hypothetical protein
MDKKNAQKEIGHLFNVEILISGSSNGIALEKLTHLLNSEAVVDYKVNSGIILGKIIDASIEENQKELTFKKELHKAQDAKTKEVKSPVIKKPNDNKQILDLIHHFKENGTLVRLSILKGKGIKLNIPCRIINYDPEMENVSVYHVDEKKVYLLRLNEIDDFVIN